MVRKVSTVVGLSLVTVIFAIAGSKFLLGSFAASFSTSASCLGSPLSTSLSAPSSVNPAANFGLTNVTSTTTAPAGYTITKIVSTTTVTNATPTSLTATWTGSKSGTFTISLPDSSLTATGSAGSQITLNLSRIDVYINGGTNPLTCSVANGQLTATSPGQSLTVATIGITTPPPPPPPPPPPSGGGSTNPAPSSITTSTTSSPAVTTQTTSNSSTPTNQPTTPAVNTTTSPSPAKPAFPKAWQKVTIVVTNAASYPLKNTEVKLDNGPPVLTNDQGVATFTNQKNGQHKVQIVTKDQTVSRTFNLTTQPTAYTLTVKVPNQISRTDLVIRSMPSSFLFSLIILLPLGTFLAFRYLSRPKQVPASPPIQPIYRSPPTII